MRARVVSSARSDVGRVRKVNEDSILAREPVFAVADGMGGHAKGDAASQTAVATLERMLAAVHTEGSLPAPDEVRSAVREANTAVRSLSGADEIGVAVAGTTLAAVVEVMDAGTLCWMVVNVGDSRVYSWNGRTLSQLSVDHSAVQEMLDAGLIGAGEAAEHPDRNIITRALGAENTVEMDSWLIPVEGTQSFLVCSDGLCKELDDERIAQILAQTPLDEDGDGLADVLVEAAVEAGGRDNVSVIVVESQVGDGSDDPDETWDRQARSPELLEDTKPRGRTDHTSA